MLDRGWVLNQGRWDRLGRWSRGFGGPFNITGPYQHTIVFVYCQFFRVDEFVFEVFQVRVIQVKLPLQCPIGDPLVLLEPVDDVGEDLLKCHDCPSVNASNNALASCKSAVSKPSVNQLYTEARRSYASWRLPCCCHRRARFVAVRNSKDLACWL